jgi:predicted transposase/invertase (TIGR01784 family)
MARSPHDRLFKFTFRRRENAASALRALLPPALAARADWDSLQVMPGSFVDAALSERHTDLLYQLEIDGRPALVYLLFEHQSGPDARMPLRILRYMVKIWTAWADDNAGPLPPVIPCVLYHGDDAWRGPTRFEHLFDLEHDVAEVGLRDLVPHFGFLLDDLVVHDDAELHARTLTAMATAALLLLKHGRTADDLPERLVAWTDTLRAVLAADNGLRAFEAFSRYILQVNAHVEVDDLVRIVRASLGEEAGRAAMTAGERLIEEGMRRGVAKGSAGILLKLITLRFGPPPPEVEARVCAASLEQHDRWTEAILTAPTLEALLAERGDDA